MTPDQHANAKELFLRARDLSQERLAAFLNQECGDDDALRQEVTSLLRFDTDETLVVQQPTTKSLVPRKIAKPTGHLATASNAPPRKSFSNFLEVPAVGELSVQSSFC